MPKTIRKRKSKGLDCPCHVSEWISPTVAAGGTGRSAGSPTCPLIHELRLSVPEGNVLSLQGRVLERALSRLGTEQNPHETGTRRSQTEPLF